MEARRSFIDLIHIDGTWFYAPARFVQDRVDDGEITGADFHRLLSEGKIDDLGHERLLGSAA